MKMEKETDGAGEREDGGGGQNSMNGNLNSVMNLERRRLGIKVVSKQVLRIEIECYQQQMLLHFVQIMFSIRSLVVSNTS